jgi:hypothetical protein
MKNLKVKIIAVPVSDAKGITDVQQKLNQWMTTEKLKKYKVFTTSEHIVFHICLHK